MRKLTDEEVVHALAKKELHAAVRAELAKSLRNTMRMAQARIDASRYLDACYDAFHASLICAMLVGYSPAPKDVPNRLLNARLRNPVAAVPGRKRFDVPPSGCRKKASGKKAETAVCRRVAQ